MTLNKRDLDSILDRIKRRAPLSGDVDLLASHVEAREVQIATVLTHLSCALSYLTSFQNMKDEFAEARSAYEAYRKVFFGHAWNDLSNFDREQWKKFVDVFGTDKKEG